MLQRKQLGYHLMSRIIPMPLSRSRLRPLRTLILLIAAVAIVAFAYYRFGIRKRRATNRTRRRYNEEFKSAHLDDVIDTVRSVGPYDGSSSTDSVPFDAEKHRISSSPRRAADRVRAQMLRRIPLDRYSECRGEGSHDDESSEDPSEEEQKQLEANFDNAAYHEEIPYREFCRLVQHVPTRADNRKHSTFTNLNINDLPEGVVGPLSDHLENVMNEAYETAFGFPPGSPEYRLAVLDIRTALLSTTFPEGVDPKKMFDRVRVAGLACFHRRGKASGLCTEFVADVYISDKMVYLRTIIPAGRIPEEFARETHVVPAT